MADVDASRSYRPTGPWPVALLLTVAVAAVSLAIEPDVRAIGVRPEELRQLDGETLNSVVPLPGPRTSLRPYKGLGTWVDIYDEKEWKDPEAAVTKMANARVQTLFLETANYRIKRAIFKPKKTASFIDAADAAGIDIVAWYVPDFKNLDRDLRRSRAALELVTDSGGFFDGFALDIEATVVSDVDKRNRRMFRLTDRLQRAAPGTAIAAITPDPIGSLYWPSFPYAGVGKRYDVMMTMGYFTYRTSGARRVARHVASGIKAIRAETTTKIHYIGGLSMAANRRETKGYALEVGRHNILGGGLYDFTDTRSSQWKALRRLKKLRP